MFAQAMMMATAGGGLNVADVFSTDLWAGTGAARTITNGLDLSGEGGMVWIKNRAASSDHNVFDTERGATKWLITNATSAENTSATSLTGFKSDGFGLGSQADVNGGAGQNYVGWSSRQHPRFMKAIKYTGDGTYRAIPHGLETIPGLAIIKRVDGADNWYAQHVNLDGGYVLLQSNIGSATSVPIFTAAMDASHIYVGNNNGVNGGGVSYIMYVFAHDEAGDGVIQCGIYTGNGSATGPVIDLGWEPQWLLIKRSDGSGQWTILDAERGWTGQTDAYVVANLPDAETASFDVLSPLASGFQIKSNFGVFNAAGSEYIYMAIRAENT